MSYKKAFIQLIESKLSEGESLKEALRLFDFGILSYHDIITKDKLSLIDYIEKEQQRYLCMASAITELN